MTERSNEEVELAVSRVVEQAHAVLRMLLKESPSDCSARLRLAAALRAALHEELALVLRDSLNQYLQAAPHQTPEDRNRLAGWLNTQLRLLGLTLRCPRSGRPAILTIDQLAGKRAAVTRFRLQSWDKSGHRQRLFSSQELPEFELMPDPPRIESLSRAYRRTGLDVPPQLRQRTR